MDTCTVPSGAMATSLSAMASGCSARIPHTLGPGPEAAPVAEAGIPGIVGGEPPVAGAVEPVPGGARIPVRGVRVPQHLVLHRGLGDGSAEVVLRVDGGRDLVAELDRLVGRFDG